MIQDFRFALRQLLQSKGFAATAILTLALGIGANSAIFTLVHTVMLKSLPVADPAQLYRLGDTEDCCVVGGYRARTSIFAYPFYLYLRDNTPEFAELAAFQASVGGVGVRRGSGPSLPYDDKYVSGNYFTMLGIKPYAGRLLSPSDDRAGAPPVAVISYRAWVAFGSDPSLVGSTLAIEGTPMTITGIALRDSSARPWRPRRRIFGSRWPMNRLSKATTRCCILETTSGCISSGASSQALRWLRLSRA